MIKEDKLKILFGATGTIVSTCSLAILIWRFVFNG
jgi:hypothetical protein